MNFKMQNYKKGAKKADNKVTDPDAKAMPRGNDKKEE